MTTFLEILFWVSVGLIAYVYLAYPLIAWAWSLTVFDPAQRVARSLSKRMLSRYARYTRFVHAEPVWPTVSLIIAAYKEEEIIMQRLHNAVMVDYPADKLEIIVGCDGNEDSTGELVDSFQDSRVRLLQFPDRRGKASVLNDCVPQARGEIIIFSDANTMFDPQAIRKLVRHFQDSEVGGVCGKLMLVDGVTGENADGMYWRYENFMKRSEGRLGALLGFNGAIYAIRGDLYQPIPPQTIIDDFLIGMRIHLAEKQLIYDESAVAYEETAPHVQAEFHRRARIGAGGFQSLMWLAPLLHPRRGRLAWAFWSHKVLRWLCPSFLAIAAITNVALVSRPFFARILLVQELFYVTAIFGLFFSDGRRWQRYLKLQALFVSVNAALFVGFWRWHCGIKYGTWKRTERAPAGAPSQTEESIKDIEQTKRSELTRMAEQQLQEVIP
ncbi:MAG: glycosyltransferase family 2 protein [Planctomycetaceae bacterium]